MKHRYLKIIAFASLACYATIVVAVQGLHWIPGWACSCHTTRVSTDLHHEFGAIANSAGGEFDASQIDGVSHFICADEQTNVWDLDCPICHWFSMAQQSVPALRFSIEVKVCDSCKLPATVIRHETVGGILPRGPPLKFAVSSFV